MPRDVYAILANRNNRLMLKHVLKFSELINEGINDGLKLSEGKLQEMAGQKIIWYGMGASALIGDYINSYLIGRGLFGSIKVMRTFSLIYDEDAIYVFYSYSGNTFETLHAFQEAMKRISPERMLVFSTDGQIEKIAEKNNIRNVKLAKLMNLLIILEITRMSY